MRDQVGAAYTDPYERQTRAPALVCSLTRAAAAEAAGRDTGLHKSQIGTLHAFAYRALDKPALVAGSEKEWNAEPYVPPAWRLKETGADARDDPIGDGSSAVDSVPAQYHLMRATLTPRERWTAGVAQFAARYEAWKQREDLLDFDDIIEIAARDVAHAPGNPTTIYMDEAQDSAALLLHLARRWAAAAEELVLIGDPWQSIYRFSGAHPEMFFSDKIHHTDILGQSYRVPRAVHALAERWVRQLSCWRPVEYHPRDHDGETGRTGATWKTPEQAVRLAEAEIEQGRTAMLMAPCAYMLNPTLAVMRRRGTPFSNRWRRKNGAWNPLAPRRGTSIADRIRSLYALDGTWTVAQLDDWAQKLVSDRALLRGAKTSIAAAAKRVPHDLVTAEQLEQWFRPDVLAELATLDLDEPQALGRWWYQRLDARTAKTADYPLRVRARHGPEAIETEPRITVGTIHSLKGAEADSVILFPDLSPRGVREWHAVGERRDEVIRLGYVAVTRARERLIVAQPTSGAAMPVGRML